MKTYGWLIDYLGGPGEAVVGELAFEAILMHDPVALLPLGSPASVEHERLFHSHERSRPRAVNLPVFPRRLPIPCLRCPVRPQPGWVLPISQTEKVPLFLSHLGSH